MIPMKLKWYENRHWSNEEQLCRILDVEACKALVSRKLYLYNQQQWEQELDTLWVRQPENQATASYGSHWGFYTGMDAVLRYYQSQYRSSSAGLSLFRTVNTPVVYIAADGKTAQGMWLMAGEETFKNSDDTVCGLHLYGRAAVDFIREPEGWKIWHWVDIYNMTQPVGEDIAKSSAQALPEEALLKPLFLAGKPDIQMQTHYPEYHGTDGWPKYPCAHDTYGPDNSYGPDGHPALMEHNEDVNWLLRMAQIAAWGRTVQN